jgi:hypothetical protein
MEVTNIEESAPYENLCLEIGEMSLEDSSEENPPELRRVTKATPLEDESAAQGKGMSKLKFLCHI